MRCSLLLMVGLVCTSTQALAQYVPSWWFDSTYPVIASDVLSQNNGVANLGQLKWMAARAKAHLDATIPGGSQSTINNLVAGFQLQTPANYAPINLGQLKYVALPFYDRLIAVGYNTNLNLKANGYSPLWAGNYPWDTTTANSENYKPVTIGQLKLVFSFDIVDSDGNGILDYQEGRYPAANSIRDTDGDGVPDVSDAYPNDPSRATQLVNNPSDHTAPNITILQPVGVTLTP